jgi:hypothetical protein
MARNRASKRSLTKMVEVSKTKDEHELKVDREAKPLSHLGEWAIPV